MKAVAVMCSGSDRGSSPCAPLYFEVEGGFRVGYSENEFSELIYPHEFEDMVRGGEVLPLPTLDADPTDRAIVLGVPFWGSIHLPYKEVKFFVPMTHHCPRVCIVEKQHVSFLRGEIAAQALTRARAFLQTPTAPREDAYQEVQQGVLFAEVGTSLRKELVVCMCAIHRPRTQSIYNAYRSDFPGLTLGDLHNLVTSQLNESEGVSARSVAAMAIQALTDQNDFLGYQLAAERGAVSEAQLDEIAEDYLRPQTWNLDTLVRHATFLAALVPDRFDSELVETVFKCGSSLAHQALLYVKAEK